MNYETAKTQVQLTLQILANGTHSVAGTIAIEDMCPHVDGRDVHMCIRTDAEVFDFILPKLSYSNATRIDVSNLVAAWWNKDIASKRFNALLSDRLKPEASPVKTAEMDDGTFLAWIWERLGYIHGENKNYDYMHRLAKISNDMIKSRGPWGDKAKAEPTSASLEVLLKGTLGSIPEGYDLKGFSVTNTLNTEGGVNQCIDVDVESAARMVLDKEGNLTFNNVKS